MCQVDEERIVCILENLVELHKRLGRLVQDVQKPSSPKARFETDRTICLKLTKSLDLTPQVRSTAKSSGSLRLKRGSSLEGRIRLPWLVTSRFVHEEFIGDDVGKREAGIVRKPGVRVG
jgi:hypothetical protein